MVVVDDLDKINAIGKVAEIHVEIVVQLDVLGGNQSAHGIENIANSGFRLKVALDGDVANAWVGGEGEAADGQVVVGDTGRGTVITHALQHQGACVVRIQPRFQLAGVVAVVVVCPGIGEFAIIVGASRVVAGTATIA